MAEDLKRGYEFFKKDKGGLDDSKSQDYSIYESLVANTFEQSRNDKFVEFDSGGPMTDEFNYDFDGFDDGGFLF